MSIQKIIIIILVAILGITTGSSKKVYDIVMVYERYSAGLVKKSITLDFGEIVYLENDVKSDSTLVFVHGFGGNKDTWDRLVKELDDKYHVIVIDLPGHGESVSKKTLGYTITDQAEWLHEFLKTKKVKDFYLLGHSMGGAIALRYAGNHINNVKTLILIDAMGMEQTKSDGVKLVEQSDKNPLYDVCTKERLETLLSYSMHKSPYVPELIKDVLLQEKCARRDLEKILYEDIYKDVCCLNDIAKNIHIPTLILWGEKDRMTHIDNATLFHDTIQGSHLVILKEIGHVPMLEDPERTADEVDKFIRQINGKSKALRNNIKHSL
ncbi:alpha/beta fold hydrolase [Sulfurovum sp. CS9]|uniref:alpha/beta fold hydrolase n=1 Tax=Sulfurovum sp. CS9 TaxID=3391146 RepID=UPI0039EAE311